MKDWSVEKKFNMICLGVALACVAKLYFMELSK